MISDYSFINTSGKDIFITKILFGFQLPSFVISTRRCDRYAGLLLAPAEGFGLQPRPFFAFRAKKRAFFRFGLNFGNFW